MRSFLCFSGIVPYLSINVRPYGNGGRRPDDMGSGSDDPPEMGTEYPSTAEVVDTLSALYP